jgi:hypothetical protein
LGGFRIEDPALAAEVDDPIFIPHIQPDDSQLDRVNWARRLPADVYLPRRTFDVADALVSWIKRYNHRQVYCAAFLGLDVPTQKLGEGDGDAEWVIFQEPEKSTFGIILKSTHEDRREIHYLHLGLQANLLGAFITHLLNLGDRTFLLSNDVPLFLSDD